MSYCFPWFRGRCQDFKEILQLDSPENPINKIWDSSMCHELPNICLFCFPMGRWSNLTCAYFSDGWLNHQLVYLYLPGALVMNNHKRWIERMVIFLSKILSKGLSNRLGVLHTGHDTLLWISSTWNSKQPVFLWLFQLDDSKSLHKKWLFHQTSIKVWLFRVPGIGIPSSNYLRPTSGAIATNQRAGTCSWTWTHGGEPTRFVSSLAIYKVGPYQL